VKRNIIFRKLGTNVESFRGGREKPRKPQSEDVVYQPKLWLIPSQM